jgi:transketolase
MKVPSIFWWTHDSIAVGGDGPTHEPVEHLAALRAIPGLDVVRPADANETAACFRQILQNTDRPAGFVLSRQNLPVLEPGKIVDAFKGGYVLEDAGTGRAKVILIATGSEVSLALKAREALEAEGTPTRVVSMPCREWFDAQPGSYRQEVLPPDTRARVSIEAGVGQGWREVVGDAGEIVSVEQFGASAPGDVVYEQYGFTTDRVVAAAHSAMQHASA